jgi:hypothetical protein
MTQERRQELACISASRSTVMCEIGNGKRSRAVETTPHSNQFERPSRWVEMMISFRAEGAQGRAEGAQGVLDRLDGINITHLTVRLDPDFAKGGKTPVKRLSAAALAPASSEAR